MGRELRRKQAKKDKTPLKEEKIIKIENPYEDIYKLLKTFGIILAVILLIYFVVALLITKEIDWFSKNDDNQSEVQTVKNSILAKNTFEQKEEEYYVYFYNFEEENTSIASLISSKLSEDKVYRVNTNDALNSNYITEEEVGNNTADSIDNLKVINPTLIKISGDTILEYHETKDNVISYLEQ